VHSDQGSQYGSDDFRRFCKSHNLEPSMSRRGNCWDSAVAESFFSSLKKERIRKRVYKTRDLARADIFDFIEVLYNRIRRHSHLGGISHEAFESAAALGWGLSIKPAAVHRPTFVADHFERCLNSKYDMKQITFSILPSINDQRFRQ
jgi:putative transposase